MANKNDLIGQKFNFLTVIEKAPSKGKNSYWKCKCDCGNEVEVRRDCLTKGTIKSCGCFRKQIKSNNLTGQRFGKLIALEPTEERQRNRVIWKCQCDCGNICYVSSDYLKSGGTSSCGCLSISKGEYIIQKILEENNLIFEKQKYFETCKFPDTNCYAKFDFYVNNQYLIEFDGEQHFIPRDYFGGEKAFYKQKQNDIYKSKWCKENNIPLIRIPYTHKNIILDDLLLEKTKFIDAAVVDIWRL